MGRAWNTNGTKRERQKVEKVEKPEGNRQLRRSRSRREANIKMDVRKIGWGVMDWIHLPGDRDQWRALVNAVNNLRAP
jgi:hypothetical protein